MNRPTITLANASDTFSFTLGMPGMPLVLDRGRLRSATRSERIGLALRRRWERATRWWRPRFVVAAIDHERGIITMETERWSWGRWDWVRS